MTCKCLENRKFTGCKRNFLIAFRKFASTQIKREVAETNDFIFFARCSGRINRLSAAQNGMQTGQQFAGIVGFREIIVGAQFKAQDSIDVFSFSGKHQDRRCVIGSTDSLQNGNSVFARHHDVQNHGVKTFS